MISPGYSYEWAPDQIIFSRTDANPVPEILAPKQAKNVGTLTTTCFYFLTGEKDYECRLG